MHIKFIMFNKPRQRANPDLAWAAFITLLSLPLFPESSLGEPPCNLGVANGKIGSFTTVCDLSGAIPLGTGKVEWLVSPNLKIAEGGGFSVSAEAYANVPPQKVAAAALDYERYVEKRVPTVAEAHVVSQTDLGRIVWFRTQLAGRQARYYVRVNVMDSGSKHQGSGS